MAEIQHILYNSATLALFKTQITNFLPDICESFTLYHKNAMSAMVAFNRLILMRILLSAIYNNLTSNGFYVIPFESEFQTKRECMKVLQKRQTVGYNSMEEYKNNRCAIRV